MAGTRGASSSSALTPVVGPDRGPSGVLVFGLIVVLLVGFVAVSRLGRSAGNRPPAQATFAGAEATGSPGASSRGVPLATPGPSPTLDGIPGTPPPRVSATIRAVAPCPPGSKPDVPGPVAQDRPMLTWSSPMAFDRRAGRIVVLVGQEHPETWTFDVCTNTWLKAHPDPSPPMAWGQLTYDEDSDLTIMVDPMTHKAWAYDLGTDTWTAGNSAPLPMGHFPWFVSDQVSGLVVALDSTEASPASLLAYDVDDDAWSQIRQTNALEAGDPGHVLFAFDGSVDRFIAYDTRPSGTWLFDRRTGSWDRSAAFTPVVNLGYGATGTEIVYDEAIQRTVVFSDGMVIAYDAAAAHWEVWDDGSGLPLFEGHLATGPTARMGHSIVYDPVNERIVVYGGHYRTAATDPDQMWVQADDVLAFDPLTREWSTLLEASKVQPPPG